MIGFLVVGALVVVVVVVEVVVEVEVVDEVVVTSFTWLSVLSDTSTLKTKHSQHIKHC